MNVQAVHGMTNDGKRHLSRRASCGGKLPAQPPLAGLMRLFALWRSSHKDPLSSLVATAILDSGWKNLAEKSTLNAL